MVNNGWWCSIMVDSGEECLIMGPGQVTHWFGQNMVKKTEEQNHLGMVYAIYLHRYKLWFWRCFFLNLPTWFPYFGEEPSSYTSYFRVPFWYQYCSVLHSTKKIQELSIVRVYVDLLEGYHEQCGDMFQIESGSLTIDDVFFGTWDARSKSISILWSNAPVEFAHTFASKNLQDTRSCSML